MGKRMFVIGKKPKDAWSMVEKGGTNPHKPCKFFNANSVRCPTIQIMLAVSLRPMPFSVSVDVRYTFD